MLTQEQLEQRRLGIGGSDVPAILGLSPWKTPLDVYYDKTGEAEPLPVDDGPDTPIYWGNVLEDTVSAEYAKRTGYKIRRRNQPIVHPEVPVARANLDRVVVSHPDGPGVFEAKTARAPGDAWGEAGTDQVPDYYMPQVMHYLAVTGYRWAELAVLFLADRELRIYHIDRDDELCEYLLQYEADWWKDHIESRVPPAPMTAEDMARAWPVDTGEQVIAPPDIEGVCLELAGVKDEIKQLSGHKTELELSIKSVIGDASELVAPDGKKLATWKSAKPGRVTDWKEVAAVMSKHLPPDVAAGIIRANTKEKAGPRRFLLKV